MCTVWAVSVCDEVPSTVRSDTVTDGGTRGGLQACQTDRRDRPRKCGTGGERQGSLWGRYTTKRLRPGARGTARDSAVFRGWPRMGTVRYQGARAVEGGWPDRSQRSRLDWPLRLGMDGLITGDRMSSTLCWQEHLRFSGCSKLMSLLVCASLPITLNKQASIVGMRS